MRPVCSVSPELLAFLKTWEGVRSRVYLDSVKKPTVGVGHLILAGDNLVLGELITDAEVDRFLTQDVQIALEAVNHLVTVPLTSHQCTALVSFVFNLGKGNFARSTLLRLLNAGLYPQAADELLRWNKAGGKVVKGLDNRRKAERTLFLS